MSAEYPTVFKDLAEGFSSQVKTAWRYWIIMAVIAMISLITSFSSSLEGEDCTVDVPWLEDVTCSIFFPFATIVLSVLIIAYGSTDSQAIRTRKLIQKLIDEIKGSIVLPANLYLQDVFDSISSPAFSRVAPLAQSWQGRYQFYPESYQCPKYLIILATLYYLLLKIVSFLIVYIYPGYALYRSGKLGGVFSLKGEAFGIPSILYLFISLIAFAVLTQLLIGDIRYTMRAITRISARFSKNKIPQ